MSNQPQTLLGRHLGSEAAAADERRRIRQRGRDDAHRARQAARPDDKPVVLRHPSVVTREDLERLREEMRAEIREELKAVLDYLVENRCR